MIVTATFDTTKLFMPEDRETFERYFKREITAGEAARELAFTYESWTATLAGIFARGNSEIVVSDVDPGR